MLRGSTLFETKAWDLLRECEYNYDLAKFWILNAEQMAIPELRRQYFEVFKQYPHTLVQVVAE